MASDPQFHAAQRTGLVATTAAKTTYSDTTNAVLAYTAGPNGSSITGIRATPTATVTATQLQVYLSTDGTTLRLFGTEVAGAYTMAQTTQAPSIEWSQNGSPISRDNPIDLGPNERLYVAGGVANAFSWVVQGKDY